MYDLYIFQIYSVTPAAFGRVYYVSGNVLLPVCVFVCALSSQGRTNRIMCGAHPAKLPITHLKRLCFIMIYFDFNNQPVSLSVCPTDHLNQHRNRVKDHTCSPSNCKVYWLCGFKSRVHCYSVMVDQIGIGAIIHTLLKGSVVSPMLVFFF